MGAFPKILKVRRILSLHPFPPSALNLSLPQALYSADVLSDQGIIYWHTKGSKPQARAIFLASAEPLVTYLKENEDEEESDEE